MRSSTTGVNVVGAASSSTNATTLSAAGVTVVDAFLRDRFDLDISTLGSSRATPDTVYIPMTAGVVAVSSTGYSKRRISSIHDLYQRQWTSMNVLMLRLASRGESSSEMYD